MFPNKLQHGDTLASLLQKYNEMVDYLREIRLVAGSGIRINRLATGTTIESTATATRGGVSQPSGYSGMFTLQLQSDEVEEYVSVIDGMEPDGNYCGTVGYGGESYQVQTFETAVLPGDYWYFYLVKTEDGFEVFQSKNTLGFSRYVPNVLIGRVDYTGESCKVIQDHVTGPIHIDAPSAGMFGIDITADISGDQISYDYTVSGGTAYANAFGFDVEDLEGTVSNGKRYIYWSIEYDTSDYTFQNSMLREYSAPQTDSQYKKYLLIGTIARSGSMVDVKQNHNGQIQVFFWGECEHDV